MSQTFRVMIAEPLAPRAQEILKDQEGFEVFDHTSSSREEILEAVTTADALIVRSGTRVDEELLGAGETLKMVARAGIGVDNVDLEAASMRGILVVNAPDGNVITTAEHTIAMMFSLARKIPSAVSSLKGGSGSAAASWAASFPPRPWASWGWGAWVRRRRRSPETWA